MARSNRVFKRTYNVCLDRIAISQALGSVSDLARVNDVSRNTARRVLIALKDAGIAQQNNDVWETVRAPRDTDYFPLHEVQSTDDYLQNAFMNLILKEDIKPGKHFSEAAVARRLDCSPTSVREFLIKLSRFGFVRKEPQKHWVLEGFTRTYAEELYEVRLLFELRTIEKLMELPDDASFWPSMYRMLSDHRTFLDHYETEYLEFPKLDSRFHRLLNSAASNRFFDSFQEVIALIFHYHYRWNKADEKERNVKAAQEHIAVIECLLLRDADAAKRHLETHLKTAKLTLLRSVVWDGASD
jgi:DNA-binding GntR family transcriptional regulator